MITSVSTSPARKDHLPGRQGAHLLLIMAPQSCPFPPCRPVNVNQGEIGIVP